MKKRSGNRASPLRGPRCCASHRALRSHPFRLPSLTPSRLAALRAALASRGKPRCGIPRRASLGAPLESPTAGGRAIPAALPQAPYGRWSVLPFGQQKALAARRLLCTSLVGRCVRLSPSSSPTRANVGQLQATARVRCAQCSPGPSLRSGCGFRAGPCSCLPPTSFIRTAMNSVMYGGTATGPDCAEGDQRTNGSESSDPGQHF